VIKTTQSLCLPTIERASGSELGASAETEVVGGHSYYPRLSVGLERLPTFCCPTLYSRMKAKRITIRYSLSYIEGPRVIGDGPRAKLVFRSPFLGSSTVTRTKAAGRTCRPTAEPTFFLYPSQPFCRRDPGGPLAFLSLLGLVALPANTGHQQQSSTQKCDARWFGDRSLSQGGARSQVYAAPAAKCEVKELVDSVGCPEA